MAVGHGALHGARCFGPWAATMLIAHPERRRPGLSPAFVHYELLTGDQSKAFQLQNHLMGAVVDLDILGLDPQFRVLRYVIRI